MTTDIERDQTTRMLFLGDDSLADGFRLIGFETLPSSEQGDVERVFRDLSKGRERAFVIVDDQIMSSGIKGLSQIRQEGGRIVVVSIPRLKEPPRLASEVADRLASMFGDAPGDPR